MSATTLSAADRVRTIAVLQQLVVRLQMRLDTIDPEHQAMVQELIAETKATITQLSAGQEAGNNDGTCPTI